MRIESLHHERRVEPVDRQNRRDQRRKDEERSEREQQEEAYILNLTRGEVGKKSPFISGAYTRMGAIKQSEVKTMPEPQPGERTTYEPGPRQAGSRFDTSA
ncbi:MAG: hypothetical protein JJ896_02180 [Rhodothermales bacterium]|nr:hypothetical protein [Rhodothermales bacterium]MBO6778437.1 hypothetical protein [Rhodothermales bacterium]